MPPLPAAPQQNFQQAFLMIEPKKRIDCWFNPTKLDLHRSAGWVQKSALGQEAPKSSYKGGEADSLTLNLLLHADETRSGRQLRADLQQLWALPLPSITRYGDKQNRPPRVEFHWGEFISFTAVCKSVDASVELFDIDGTPLRVLVTLALTQFEPEPALTGALKMGPNPTSRATRHRRMHTIRAGETLAQIAFEHLGDGTKWRRLAQDNRIEDPLRIAAGQELWIRLEDT